MTTLKVIAAFAEEKSVSEGDTLVREGDFSDQLIAIEEGSGRGRHGDEAVATLGPGDFFGEDGVVASRSAAPTSSPRRACG